MNVGCGVRLLADFINVDKFFTREDLERKEGLYSNAVVEEGAEFVQADACRLPFPDDYADYILSDCMIEHLSHAEVIPTLVEWRRVLKPSGELVIITTDFDELARLWMINVARSESHDEEIFTRLAQVIYGNQAGEGEFHRWPFTPRYMKRCLLMAGWPYFGIALHPTNTPVFPVRGYPDVGRENHIVLTSMIYVSARKQPPPGAEDDPNVHMVDIEQEVL